VLHKKDIVKEDLNKPKFEVKRAEIDLILWGEFTFHLKILFHGLLQKK
jgi:hypothetical protein